MRVLAHEHERTDYVSGTNADPDLTRAGLIVAAAGAAVTGLAAVDDFQAAITPPDRRPRRTTEGKQHDTE